MFQWLSDNSEGIGAAASLVAAFATTVGVVAATLIAAFTISSHRRSNRERATLDTLIRIELDQDYIQHRRRFNQFVKPDGEELSYLLLPSDLRESCRPANAVTSLDDSKKVQSLRIILDIYELLSLSIAEHSLDERVYHKWFHGQLLKDWALTKSFILALRRRQARPAIYRHFEWLAARWGGEPSEGFSPRIKTLAGPILTFHESPKYLGPRS